MVPKSFRAEGLGTATLDGSGCCWVCSPPCSPPVLAVEWRLGDDTSLKESLLTLEDELRSVFLQLEELVCTSGPTHGGDTLKCLTVQNRIPSLLHVCARGSARMTAVHTALHSYVHTCPPYGSVVTVDP